MRFARSAGPALLAVVAACSVPQFNPIGKHCAVNDPCPGDLVCLDSPSDPSGETCRRVARFQTGVYPDPSYAGFRGALLKQAKSTQNFSTEPTLQFDGNEDGFAVFPLFGFDVTAAPKDITVQYAGLRLTMTNASPSAYSLKAMRRDWVESEVTWSRSSATTGWASPGAAGADDVGEVMASVVPLETGPYVVWFGDAGTERVEDWLADDRSNHGMAIRGTATDGADFNSKTAPQPSDRPLLMIQYVFPSDLSP